MVFQIENMVTKLFCFPIGLMMEENGKKKLGGTTWSGILKVSMDGSVSLL